MSAAAVIMAFYPGQPASQPADLLAETGTSANLAQYAKKEKWKNSATTIQSHFAGNKCST